jgi:hypothetical protein
MDNIDLGFWTLSGLILGISIGILIAESINRSQMQSKSQESFLEMLNVITKP